MTRERNHLHETVSPGTALSDSHLDITSSNPSLPNHPPGAKQQEPQMLGARSLPHRLPPCRQGTRVGSHAPLSGGRPMPLTRSQTIPQHHSRLRVSSVCLSVCLSLPPGKVSGEQAPHGPDAVLLTASADRPVGETPGTAAGDGAFRGEWVPAGERA